MEYNNNYGGIHPWREHWKKCAIDQRKKGKKCPLSFALSTYTKKPTHKEILLDLKNRKDKEINVLLNRNKILKKKLENNIDVINSNEYEALQTKYFILKAEKKDLLNKIEEYDNFHIIMKKKYEKSLIKYNKLKDEYEELLRSHIEKKKKYKNLKKINTENIKDMTNIIEDYDDKIKIEQEKVLAREKIIEMRNITIDQLQNENYQYNIVVGFLEDEKKILNQELDNLNSELNKKINLLSNLDIEKENFNKEIDKLIKEKEDKELEILSLYKKIDDEKNKIDIETEKISEKYTKMLNELSDVDDLLIATEEELPSNDLTNEEILNYITNTNTNSYNQFSVPSIRELNDKNELDEMEYNPIDKNDINKNILSLIDKKDKKEINNGILYNFFLSGATLYKNNSEKLSKDQVRYLLLLCSGKEAYDLINTKNNSKEDLRSMYNECMNNY